MLFEFISIFLDTSIIHIYFFYNIAYHSHHFTLLYYSCIHRIVIFHFSDHELYCKSFNVGQKGYQRWNNLDLLSVLYPLFSFYYILSSAQNIKLVLLYVSIIYSETTSIIMKLEEFELWKSVIWYLYIFWY